MVFVALPVRTLTLNRERTNPATPCLMCTANKPDPVRRQSVLFVEEHGHQISPLSQPQHASLNSFATQTVYAWHPSLGDVIPGLMKLAVENRIT